MGILELLRKLLKIIGGGVGMLVCNCYPMSLSSRLLWELLPHY